MRTPNRPYRWLAVLLACLMIGPVSTSAQNDDDLPDDPLANPDQWLSDSRFSEIRYGLSVREPHDAIRLYDTQRDEVIRWALEGGTRISLSFAHGVYESLGTNGKPVRIPAKIDVLNKQLGYDIKTIVSGHVTNTRANQVIEVGTLVGLINYYAIQPRNEKLDDYLHGVALLQLDELSVAVVKLECLPENIVSAVSTFECLVNSIEVEPAKDVNRRLNGWLTTGQDLLDSLTQEDRLRVMKDDRLYRVLDNGKDLGYVRVWQRFQDKAHYDALRQRNAGPNGEPGRLEGIDRFRVTGNAFVRQSMYQGRGAKIERLIEAVDAVDDTSGYWQIKNAMSYKNDPTNRRAGAWVETGVRGITVINGSRLDHIQLTREGTPPRHMVDYLLEREKDPSRRLRYPSADPRSYPSGDLKENAWPVPKRAFLSYVDAELMPAMLPSKKQTYAFTAYDPETTSIAIRVMRVEPNPNGGKTVYLRQVLDQSEQKLVFDRNNELVSRTYPDGREVRRTTRAELARLWEVKLKD